MNEARISLVCCTQVLLQDIGAKESRQKDIALTYAMAIRSESCGDDKPDWKTINEAILRDGSYAACIASRILRGKSILARSTHEPASTRGRGKG